MSVFHRAGTASLLVLAGVLLVSAGCAKRGRGVVKGHVVFFDKKLNAGTVGFQTQDGRIGAGNIDFEGNYTVPDAPLGPCVVTVRVPQPPAIAPGTKNPYKPPGNMVPMRPPGGGGEADVPSPSLVDFSKIVQIPGKYAKPESSGLTFTVEPGEQTYNITLSP
jgi:hypothetical protein